MKAIILKAIASQFFQIWHLDGATKSAGVSKTDIVQKNHHHIGCLIWGCYPESGGCFSIPCVQFGYGDHLGFPDGKDGTVRAGSISQAGIHSMCVGRLLIWLLPACQNSER